MTLSSLCRNERIQNSWYRKELRNENIDVINYTSNNQLFIQRALSPAKITSIKLVEETMRAEIYLKPNEVSLAIGKGGLKYQACKPAYRL